jgi:hypothetical protein
MADIKETEMIRTTHRWLAAYVLVVGLATVAAGCGPKAVNVTPPTVSSAVEAKTILDEVASSGEIDSGTDALRGLFEQMQASDATKAESLLRELDVLLKGGSPDTVKSQAKKMLSLL